MKKLISLFFVASLFLIGFTACEQTEKPGGIPGMGETPGELEIDKPFVAPEGVTIDVAGLDEIRLDDAASGSANLKSAQWSWGNTFSCGGSKDKNDFVFWINVNISMSNSNNSEMCVTIPQGTVFETSDPNGQNGILLTDMKICVKAHEVVDCNLMLMCLNYLRPGSKKDIFYKMLGTTNSKLLQELISYLKGKKIGIEFYTNIVPSSKLKSTSAEDLETYKEIADRIQNTIWDLTNHGKNISQDDIDFFNSIPDIE